MFIHFKQSWMQMFTKFWAIRCQLQYAKFPSLQINVGSIQSTLWIYFNFLTFNQEAEQCDL